MKKRILVVEDDAALARVLRDNFEFEGFEVEWVADGNEAINRARAFAPDLVVLDVMLPGRDGFTLCTVLRQGGRTPIVLLSARSQKADKLKGLHLGADDYVTKPFNIDELLARLRAVTRRVPVGDEAPCVQIGSYLVDLQAHRVTSAAATDAQRPPVDLHLTPTEWQLLEQLVRNPGKLVSQRELLLKIWGPKYVEETHYLRQYMAQLRRKLEPDPARPRHLLTELGMGYRYQP
jgi:two-component system, OmpR family, KDP operon response regulator KdpE